MAAPKRIIHALSRNTELRKELERLEKRANEQIREIFPRFRYRSAVTRTLVEDLAAVVSQNEWRGPLERTADRLRHAANHIRDAVRLVMQAAIKCPTYATIPPLFGKGGAVESFMKRQGRPVIDLRKIAPGFLKAMLVYAMICEREARRMEAIRTARSRHFDRLGPILSLIRDVQSFTGNPHDSAVARLLTDAHEISGSRKLFTADQIRKYRNRYLKS